MNTLFSILLFFNIVGTLSSHNLKMISEEQPYYSTTTMPVFLYKLISKVAWEESLQKQKLCLSPMDADFIHLATNEQVDHVAKKFWAGVDYVILQIDTKQILGELRYETNPGGTTKYYHLYEGLIPLKAIVSVD